MAELSTTYIGHQSWMVSTESTHILIDPVLTRGFGFSEHLEFTVFPHREVLVDRLPAIAAVVLTNEHLDHFHIPSLKLLPPTVQVYLPDTAPAVVFDTLDRAIGQLGTSGRTAAQIAQGNTDALRDIDQSMSQLQGARAAAGEMLVRIDSETGRLADQKLANQSERSRAEDLDMTDAISKFQNLQTGYDAALKSYSMVQRLSLFDYLKA